MESIEVSKIVKYLDIDDDVNVYVVGFKKDGNILTFNVKEILKE